MSKILIDELKRIRSILSAVTGFEDDDQEYVEDARKSVDQIIEGLAEQPAQQEPFGYFQYDIRLDAWVQNRVNNKGVAFYIKEQK